MRLNWARLIVGSFEMMRQRRARVTVGYTDIEIIATIQEPVPELLTWKKSYWYIELGIPSIRTRAVSGIVQYVLLRSAVTKNRCVVASLHITGENYENLGETKCRAQQHKSQIFSQPSKSWGRIKSVHYRVCSIIITPRRICMIYPDVSLCLTSQLVTEDVT